MSKNPHKGTSFDDYLREEGIYEETHEHMEKKYGHLMENNKRAKGVYYTNANPFYLTPFKKWLKTAPKSTILEPFAGANNIPQMFDTLYDGYQWQSYDIQPAHENVEQRDTIKDFPMGFDICITNPP